MSVARARHYPAPPPVATVLHGDRCGHGELGARCPLCRRAGEALAEPPPTAAAVGGDQDPLLSMMALLFEAAVAEARTFVAPDEIQPGADQTGAHPKPIGD